METKYLKNRLVEIIQDKFPAIGITESASGVVLVVPADELLATMGELHDNKVLAFDFLTNLTSVDYPETFTVIYNLVSLKHGFTLEVQTNAEKSEPHVPSVSAIWGAADWLEREVYDLMGIEFDGHPNLERILLGDEFKGYPLRKDFKYAGGRQ